MLRLSEVLIGAALLVSISSASALDTRHPTRSSTIGRDHKSRPLQGRFLHITDFHPDPFFETYSSTKETAACHRKHGPAGYYGAETSACDSPISLVNATLDWIKHNVADKVDFVIWTGDSARHDNDEKIPRTQKQVVEQNEFMVRKMAEVFGNGNDPQSPPGSYKIPVVPTFGNNDIMPHNIMLAGPNRWTVKYLDLWRSFIPEAQRHQFQQGGWFSVEVIPGKLAVVSLNTLYFFTSNSGVDGCAKKREPGYEQFDWLRIQLQILRERGMSAILIGHVPPARVDSKESWDETCWQKYALWERQYRDVIVGSLFGHMNIDHFMLQDFHHIKKSAKKGLMGMSSVETQWSGNEADLLTDGEVSVASASDYLIDLRWWWSKIPSPSKKDSKSMAEYLDEEDDKSPTLWQKVMSALKPKKPKGGKNKKKTFLDKIGGPYAERYSVSLVAPSVVPNYFPTIRIFEYNVTGLADMAVAPTSVNDETFNTSLQNTTGDVEFEDDESFMQALKTTISRKNKNKQREAAKKRKYKFHVPEGPSKSAPPGPAYSPQTLTFLGYTQYFANLTHINNDFVVDNETHSLNEDSPRSIFGLHINDDGSIEQSGWKEGKHGKHQGKKPKQHPHPKKFKFEVEYNTRTDKKYKLKDLTVRNFVDLARRIGVDGGGGKKPPMVTENDDAGEDHKVDGLGKPKKGKKKHRKSKNKNWLTFVDRAFVGTLDPKDLELFCAERIETVPGEAEVENMEL